MMTSKMPMATVKKHFSIQEEGDPDLFFDVPQERQEETMDTPLSDAVNNELSGGGIMVDCQIWWLLYLVLLMCMMTTSWPQKTFPQQWILPQSSPLNGDMREYVSGRK